MRVLERRVYRGPNLYAHFPVIRLTVDLGILEDYPTNKLRGYADRLLKRLPRLDEHGCSYEEAGGFVRRLREGTWMGHVWEHVAIELQNLAGAHVSFGKTRSTGRPGEYHVVYEYEEAHVGERAGKLAQILIESLLPARLRAQVRPPRPDEEEEELDLDTELEVLIKYAQKRQLGPSTFSLVRAAETRGIPWFRLNDYSLVQLGHGRYQKRIQATVTSETRQIAVEIASDKVQTNRILADIGLPVPRQMSVYSLREALDAADDIGYPVVVKPLDANHGRGVAANLGSEEEVRAAYPVAREISRIVIVEKHIEGLDHRMIVVGGQLIAVARREPGKVVGDGVHTVAELIEITNQDPRRGIGHEKVLTRLALDEQAQRLLARVSYTAETIPAAGENVYLRLTGNLSTGGTATDVTDIVHYDNREMAIRAAQGIGLDVAGIDFLSPDISKSWREVGGAICEVNAAPGFRMHVAPTEGTPRDPAGPVMDMLFPPGTAAAIPIATVTGTNGKTTTARMLAHIHKMNGRVVGLATTDGVYIDGQRSVEGDLTGPTGTQMVLRDPTVDLAVLEVARGGLLRSGMGTRYCDVGAVLNVAADHLGLDGVDTVEDLARVKRIVVEVARDTAVLNADDPLVLSMADYTKAKNIMYVTANPSHELVREHIRAGKAAVVLEKGIAGDMITLYDKSQHLPLLWSHLIPATMEGRALFNVQNAMFAAAMAYAMGLKIDGIRHGLRTFDTTFFQAPGRLNVYEEHPFKVIVDYGHNPPAVRAMCDLVQRLDVPGRRLVVLTIPGDRRDEDALEVARAAAPHFDHFILRRDDNLRRRGPDEIPALLMRGLLEAGVPEERMSIIPDEQQATDAGLRMARPGDLLLLFAENLTRTWKQVIYFRPEGSAAPAPSAEAAQAPTDAPRQAPTPVPPIGVSSEPLSAATSYPEGTRIIRDERGVRLAREDTED
jgi:cyanophycin synthetase